LGEEERWEAGGRAGKLDARGLAGGPTTTQRGGRKGQLQMSRASKQGKCNVMRCDAMQRSVVECTGQMMAFCTEHLHSTHGRTNMAGQAKPGQAKPGQTRPDQVFPRIAARSTVPSRNQPMLASAAASGLFPLAAGSLGICTRPLLILHEGLLGLARLVISEPTGLRVSD
jgi:hypothetical protein